MYKYRVARQKNPKGSLIPMSATNKGHIKTGDKTMIYVLSLMRLLSVHPPMSSSIVRSSCFRLYAPMSPPSLSPSVHHRLSSFPLIIFLIASLLVLLLFLLLLLRPSLLYRFRRIAPSGRRWSIRRLEKVACRYHRNYYNPLWNIACDRRTATSGSTKAKITSCKQVSCEFPSYPIWSHWIIKHYLYLKSFIIYIMLQLSIEILNFFNCYRRLQNCVM